MTTPRRRDLRPAVAVPEPERQRELQLTRNRTRLEQERAGFERWMTRLRRAANEVAKRQKRLVRLERLIARLLTHS